jgi:hypothetical protein
VYEDDAIKSTSIRKDWDLGSSYVDEVQIVKKRFYHPVYSASFDQRYCYFLAVTIKDRDGNSNRLTDLVGELRLRKSGTNGFEVYADIAVELGYNSPESDYQIPETRLCLTTVTVLTKTRTMNSILTPTRTATLL